MSRERTDRSTQTADSAKSSDATSLGKSSLVDKALAKRGSGGKPNAGIKNKVASRLGANLDNVTVHTDDAAQGAASELGARAFTYGSDVYLGKGESQGDTELMAHELTHVVQQSGGAAIQRKSELDGGGDAAEKQADDVAAKVAAGEAPALIVDDKQPELGPGQMKHSQFMAKLRPQVSDAAGDALGGFWSVFDCPYIDKYLDYYSKQSAEHVERAIKKFAPEAKSATSAEAYIPIVVARVARGVEQWKATGELPGDVAQVAPPDEQAAAKESASQESARNDDGPVIQRKPLPGYTRPVDKGSPRGVVDRLGQGTPMDSATASRVGGAMGENLSSVRVHTDSQAAEVASEQGAKALTVGNHIAFGAGEYQPNTPEGDALIAHETAHAVQQRGTSLKGAGAQQKAAAQSEAHEQDADNSAMGVMARLYAGAKGLASRIAKNTRPALSSGLSLQRCKKDSKPKITRGDRPAPLGAPTDKGLDTQRFDDDADIEKLLDGSKTLESGASGGAVRKVQQALIDLKYLDNSHGVTGTLDGPTQAALKKFQGASGLSQSGKVDAATMEKIDKAFDDYSAYKKLAENTGTGDSDLLSGTRKLDDTDRGMVAAALNPQAEVEVVQVPDGSGGFKTETKHVDPTYKEKVGGKTFEERLRTEVEAEVTSQYNAMAKGKAELRKDPKNMFEWSDLEGMGDESKREVDTVFGNYAQGPAITRAVLIDQWEKAEKDQAGMDDDQLMAIALRRVQKILDAHDGALRVYKEHGVVRDRDPEQGIIKKVKEDVAKKRKKDLLELDKAWPGKQFGDQISIQRFRSPNAKANREKMWDLFATLIHEYLHSLTHEHYVEYYNTLDDQSEHTLKEGVTDFLTKTVWANVSIGPQLAKRVEGPFYDPKDPITDPYVGYYDSTAQAEQMVGIVGARNVYAAYFLGKTEFIGKK